MNDTKGSTAGGRPGGIFGKVSRWFRGSETETPKTAFKVRDTRRPIEYWDKKDASLAKYRSIERSRELYRMACERRPDGCPLSSLLDRGIRVFLNSVCYFYSRGDDIDEIRQKSLMPAIENSLFFQTELAEHPERAGWPYLNSVGKNPTGAYESYVFLAYFVCLGADAETMRALSPLMAKAGEDRLVDLILSQYEPDRIIADKAAQPRIFGDLDKLIDATPEERIKLIEHYLDRWAVQISKLKGLALLGGVGGLEGAKSNADLEEEGFLAPNYKGWWAWEVALMVRVFGIDDTSFADHILYPLDLARYRHQTTDYEPWPIGQTPTNNTMAGSKTDQGGVPGRPIPGSP